LGHSTARPSWRTFDFEDLGGVFNMVVLRCRVLDNSFGGVTGTRGLFRAKTLL
jgi:hypothetical protein